MIRSWRAALLSVTVASGALAADASWSNQADVGVTVNGHAFHQVRVEGRGCALGVRIDFDAPDRGYTDARNAVRNYHQFRARVNLSKGQVVESKIFGNSGAGARYYDFEQDTSGVSCWARDPNKIVKLDVIGCRGRGCDVGRFE